MKTLLAAALACALPFAAPAHEYRAGAIEIGHPYAIETPRVAKAGAGYLTLTNTGTEPDALLAVEAELPQVMLHRSETTDGVTSMRHVDRLEIAPGETVTFAPGGLHVMFMGLDGGLAAGDTVPAVLVFERAGRVEVTFNVEARDGDAPAEDHSGH
ncbi:copper chaperone PCu(A)C [Roseivivax isoporae]|uniref:Copper(I)-binding protein n=1 Tax=Roseivivax isoporae LMG 25204 TaxID=1449351 RepID=X7FEF7_9RHOB|nr:copper chaperone PCu(A)C [Roseivivax isoporae]ETX30409.1 hypothetical protein RISW2_12120 [Roseivivax isoporae LMG 25204]